MIQPKINRNKSGEIISARIRVSAGYDSNGKKRIHARTVKKPHDMTEKQFLKFVQAETLKDEINYKNGYQLDQQQTFSEYATYILKCKEESGIKRRTLERYKELLKRIHCGIGHIKLQELRPQHLTAFYTQLRKTGIRLEQDKARPKQDIKSILEQAHCSRHELAVCAGVSDTTITSLCKGNTVSLQTADKVANALHIDRETLFSVQSNAKLLSEKTLLEHHRLISEILSQAEKEMLVPYNAADKVVNPPKSTKSPEPNYLQPDELDAIRAALPSEPLKWQVIVHLMLVTGCRRGEIMGLKWSAIDLEAGTLRIENNLLYTKALGVYEDTPKTESSKRTLLLPAETISLLREYRIEWEMVRKSYGAAWNHFLQIPDGSGTVHTVRAEFLFIREQPGKVGYPMNPDSPTQFLSKFSKRHNLPHINPHAFRHSLASCLNMNGIDLVMISKWLGHSNVTTTMNIYEHILETGKKAVVNCISSDILKKQA